jgi:hypothetical protein
VRKGLQNNAKSETFKLRYRVRIGQCDDVQTDVGIVRENRDALYLLPCRYIRIEPIAAWGPGANLSIWHVALHGVDDPELMESIEQEYEKVCEK